MITRSVIILIVRKYGTLCDGNCAALWCEAGSLGICWLILVLLGTCSSQFYRLWASVSLQTKSQHMSSSQLDMWYKHTVCFEATNDVWG